VTIKAISVTPAAAKSVWESQENPTNASVARVLSQVGAPVSPRKIARWKIKEWVNESRTPPLPDPAKQVEPAAARVSNPFERPYDEARRLDNELDALSTATLVNRAVREACKTQIFLGREVRRLSPDLLQRPAEFSQLIDQIAHSLALLTDLYGRLLEAKTAAEKARKEMANEKANPRRNSVDWSAFGRT
jgi:hypothetical protein